MTSGVGGFHDFRVNSLFDPDFTGAGTQPMYYNQLEAIYNTYRVTHCSASLRLVDMDTLTDGDEKIYFGLAYLSPTGVVPETGVNLEIFEVAEEFPHKKRIRIKYVNGDGNTQMGLVRLGAVPTTIYGDAKSQLKNNANYSADVSTNPVRCPRLRVFVGSTYGTPTINVQWRLKITYTCVFYNFKYVAGSA